ncbi:MAG: Kelch repeat-containing protein [Candidatus Kariarchaeaceae archaeon]
MPVNEFVSTGASTEEPTGRFGHGMAYDTINHKIILFGGTNGETGDYGYVMSDTTWIYNCKSSKWKKMNPTLSPPVRFNHKMVFNPDIQKTLLFGDGSSNDLWAYDYPSNTWEQIYTTNRPPTRSDYSIVYDSINSKLILFGGMADLGNGAETLADTWVLDYNTNTWQEMHPATQPDSRYGHTMFFDPIIEKSVLFGGHVANGPLVSRNDWYSNEVWTYDYPTNTWIELDPINPPEPRYWHAMAYDQNTQKALVFGGYNEINGLVDSTWMYDFSDNEWLQIITDTVPPGRITSSMVFDSEAEKWLLFWGLGGNGEMAINDAWEFDVSSQQWSEINFTENTNSLRNIIILSSLFVVFSSIILIKIYLNRREKPSS